MYKGRNERKFYERTSHIQITKLWKNSATNTKASCVLFVEHAFQVKLVTRVR